MVRQKEGFETKLQALESPDSDKRVRRKSEIKIGHEITIRKNRRIKPRKRKTTNRLTNERSLSGSKRRTRSLKPMNERTLAN